MEIKVNIQRRQIKPFFDSEKRSEHIMDRMIQRGIGVDQIKEAVQKGAKKRRDDGSLISEFRWFKVIYREFYLEQIRKIYPITVIEM